MKRAIRVFRTKSEAEGADIDYWLTRPVPERIAAVETLRRFSHGGAGRMKKVLRIVYRRIQKAK